MPQVSPTTFIGNDDTLYNNLPRHMFADYWADLDQSSKFVFFDVETTNEDKGSALNDTNDLVLVCWQVLHDGKLTKHYHFGDEYNQKAFVNSIKDADAVVAHNAKFDMQWLSRMGVELRDVPAYCTMMGEWVLQANRSRGLMDLSLNATAARYGHAPKINVISTMMKAGLCPSSMPRRWLLEYGQYDVDLCREIFMVQFEQIITDNLLHIVVNRNNTAACLADIEFNGMTLDAPLVAKEYDRATAELADSYAQLQALAPGVNFNSPKQMVALLYGELGFEPLKERGEQLLSSRSTILAKLKATTKRQQEFMQAYKLYNKASSLISKNLFFFKKVCEEMGTKFWGIFNQGIAATQRLTASGRPLLFRDEKQTKSVQFQNLPRQYKRLFWSGHEDYVVGEADAAQLEFRVAAALGNDGLAIEEIANGVDVHSITAQVLTANGEPTTRQEAKASTFAPLFGGMGSTKAQAEYAEFFKRKYAGISKTQRGWCLSVLEQGYLVTPYGMRYYWPDTKVVTRTGYITNTTNINNYPIQGLATAEMIPLALCSFWHLTRGTPIRIINTIHDSIVSVFPRGFEQFYEDVSKFCFTDALFQLLRVNYNYEFAAPLGCGIKYSRNWGDSPNEIIYNVNTDGSFTRKEK